MTVEDRLQQIAEYLKEEEQICKSCGSIFMLTAEMLATKQDKRGKLLVSVTCPECNSFVKWASTSKIDRIYWKGGMEELGKMDNGLLMWLMNNKYGSKKDQANVIKELKARMNGAPAPQAVVNQEVEKALTEYETYLRAELHGLDIWNRNSWSSMVRCAREGTFCKGGRELELEFIDRLLNI